MGKLADRLPKTLPLGTLVVGGMLLGAASSFTYGQLVAPLHAAEEACGQECDAEDNDDCPHPSCTCSDNPDPTHRGVCIPNAENQ